VKQELLFTELDGGVSAYGIGKHRHVAEMEQELTAATHRTYPPRGLFKRAPSHSTILMDFTPHLVPMTRGMLATITAHTGDQFPNEPTKREEAHACLTARYAQEPFVTVLPLGQSPSNHQVRGTNQCFISVHEARTGDKLILVSVIDNLVKGASGQALQNANLMFGLPETTNLELTAVFP